MRSVFQFSMAGLNATNPPTLMIPGGVSASTNQATGHFFFSNLRFSGCGTGKSFFLIESTTNSTLNFVAAASAKTACLALVSFDTASVVLQNVEISHSGNLGSSGGGLYILGHVVGTVSIEDCVFTNNSAISGGAMYLFGNFGRFSIKRIFLTSLIY